MKINESDFIWDPRKELINIAKHGVDFVTASEAFNDPYCRIFIDEKHSQNEERYFCVGLVGEKVLTVRFLYHHNKIRIIGAGYWRKGRKYYDQEKQ